MGTKHAVHPRCYVGPRHAPNGRRHHGRYPDVRPVADLPNEIGEAAARELARHGVASLRQVAERTAKELLAIHGALDRVLGVGRADPRVRAAVLSGSRVDPAAPTDVWSDVDVIFVVRDVAPFRAEPAHGWAALMAMAALFRDVAAVGVARVGFDDAWREDRRVTAHRRRVEGGDAAGKGARP